jgi:putative transposase
MKPGSFTQIYIQLVICVKFKNNRLSREVREEVFNILGNILNEYGHKPIKINGVEDHVHLFFGMNPKYALSDTVRELKRRSSTFINEKNFFRQKFSWQFGYGAFSYSQSHMQRVYDYVANQEQYHERKSFEKEYKKFLEEYEVEYDERYLFEF